MAAAAAKGGVCLTSSSSVRITFGREPTCRRWLQACMPPRSAPAFFPKAAEVIASPWILAASSDFAFPQTTGERPPNMADGARYFAALDSLVAEDPAVHRLLVQVFQLARPLWDLTAEPLRTRVLERQEQLAAKPIA